MERGDFYEWVPTMEPGVSVDLSLSYFLGVKDAALLRIDNRGVVTCSYLSDEQLVQLSAAISRYLGTEK
jgi:hypothetical protein